MSLYRTDVDHSKPSWLFRSDLLKNPSQSQALTNYGAFRLWELMTKYPDAYMPPSAHDDRSDQPSAKPWLPSKQEALAVYQCLMARLAPWLPSAPPINGVDAELLAEAAKIAALPDRHWHESGRWIETPKTDYIWERVRKRIEAEDDGELTAADKRRTLARTG
jgi:hypothetical protein